MDIVGEIISSGGAVCSTTIYYGITDENQTEENWENSSNWASISRALSLLALPAWTVEKPITTD